LRGRIVFVISDINKEYSMGYDKTCNFVLSHGVGIASQHAYIRHDKTKLWIRANCLHPAGSPAASVSLPPRRPSHRGGTAGDLVVTHVEVNSRRLDAYDPKELNHHDMVVFGRSHMFYVFTKEDGGIQQLPHDKLPFSSQNDGQHTHDNLIKEILGDERMADKEQVQLARKYYAQLQSTNMNAEGVKALREFLVKAKQAVNLIDEANEITSIVRPTSGLHFELTAQAPLLAFGYGTLCFPDLCVRLVTYLPSSIASRKLNVSKLRRQSLAGEAELIRRFTLSGAPESFEAATAKVEVLYTWTFQKFTARLQLMHDVHDQWAEDPENFEIDSLNDPWAEQGPGEIAQLQAQNDEYIQESENEIQRLRASVSALSEGRATPRAGDGPAELRQLRKKYRALELENAQLKEQLDKNQKDSQKQKNTAGRARSASNSGKQGLDPRSSNRDSNVVQASQTTSIISTPRAQGGGGKSKLLLRILDLSKANLSLVVDLYFKLSHLSGAMLRASAGCLQAPAESTAASIQSARNRLIQATNDLADFFATAGPLTGLVQQATTPQ